MKPKTRPSVARRSLRGRTRVFRKLLIECRKENGRGGDRAARALEAQYLDSLSSMERARRAALATNSALRHLNRILEEHIGRVAHELHDEAGQILAAVYLAVDELAPDLPPEAAGRLARIRRLLDKVQDQLRRLSHELHPTILEEKGLLPAMKYLCDGVAARTGAEVTLKGTLRDPLRPAAELVLYRVVQEALTNVTRHARASRVVVSLKQTPEYVTCAVRDDGVGLAEAESASLDEGRGFGLTGIRIRLAAVGGSFRISSARGSGTELRARVPMSVTHAKTDLAG